MANGGINFFFFVINHFSLVKAARVLRAFVKYAKTVLPPLTSAQWC